MKAIFALLLLLIYPLNAMSAQKKDPGSYVTYTLDGRFGDNLVSFMHAQWISYKYDIPLLYIPFVHSDRLKLHNKCRIYDESIKKSVKHVKTFTNLHDCKIRKDSSTLYIFPYCPESLFEVAVSTNLFFFPVHWEDKQFKAILKELIKPIHPVPQLELPKDRITVAVHMRLDPTEARAAPRRFFSKIPWHKLLYETDQTFEQIFSRPTAIRFSFH